MSNTGKVLPANVRFVRLMCTGRIDPEFVMKGFQSGADGVVIFGCHPGDCHYKEGNYNTLRRVYLLRRILGQFGVEEKRVWLEWISSCEAEKFVDTLHDVVKEIKAMGPLNPDGCRQYSKNYLTR